ncbi:MAG: hypothetical protein LBE09_08515 [Christensenellaceae bacterium]|jgi:hypothetical protein|nr:hypothetical protein [Christensenellaceae bacterium]
MKSFILFLVGVVVGVALVAGSVLLTGYLVLYSTTIGDISELITIDKDENGLTESENNYKIIDVIWPLIKTFGDLDIVSVAEFESAIGTRALSAFLSTLFGADAETIRAGKLQDIMSNVLNTMTLGPILKRYSITLDNSIPLFTDETFLNTPIMPQLTSFTDFRVDQIIKVVYDTDAVSGEEASDALLQKIGKLTFRELTEDEGIMEIIKGMLVGDFIEATGDPNSIIDKFLETEIGKLAEDIDNMPIDRIIPIDDNSNAVLKVLRDGTWDGGTPGTAAKVSEIGSLLQPAVEACTVGDILGTMPETETEERILTSLRDTKLTATALNNKLKILSVSDIFDDYDIGVIGLFPADTQILSISSQMTQSLTKTAVYRLNKVGVYDIREDQLPQNKFALSKLYNSTPSDVISIYIDALGGTTAGMGATHNVSGDIDVSYFSDTNPNDVMTTPVKPGDTLVLTGDTTMSNGANGDPYVIPVCANIIISGYALTLDPDGVIFSINDGNGSGYVYIDMGNSSLAGNAADGSLSTGGGPGFLSSGTFKYKVVNDGVETIMIAPLVCIESNNTTIGTQESVYTPEDNE